MSTTVADSNVALGGYLTTGIGATWRTSSIFLKRPFF